MWSWLQPPGHDLGSLGCGGRALRGPAVQTSARSRAASRLVLGVALSLGRSSRQPPAKVTHNYLRTQPDIPVGLYVSRQLAEANEGILTLERGRSPAWGPALRSICLWPTTAAPLRSARHPRERRRNPRQRAHPRS